MSTTTSRRLTAEDGDDLRSLRFDRAGSRRKWGAQEIRVDLRGKALRRCDVHPDHRIVGVYIDDELVSAGYHEPNQPWQERSQRREGTVRLLSWLVVADGYGGATAPGHPLTLAEFSIISTLDDIRASVPDTSLVTAKVHEDHAASRRLLESASFTATDFNDKSFLWYAVKL